MHYILISFLAILSIWFLFSSCTITFQNTSTNGKASDVVDDNLQTKADVSPDIETSVVP